VTVLPRTAGAFVGGFVMQSLLGPGSDLFI
jgi:hypothetical protein